MPNHFAVWIDHREARVFHFEGVQAAEETVMAPHHVHLRHPRGPEGPKEHPEDAKRFFHEVAGSLTGSGDILILGPSTAKLDFLRYAHKHDHLLEARIVGVETVDHPSDRQLVAYSKKYFKLPDATQ